MEKKERLPAPELDLGIVPVVKYALTPEAIGLQVVFKRATDGSAGFDLVWAESRTQMRYVSQEVPTIFNTGVCVEIPPGYVGLVRGRSGLYFREGVSVFEGTIDSDYRGEIILSLYSRYEGVVPVQGMSRIGQIVFVPCLTMAQKVESLSRSDRGEKGFGSTGK